VFLFQGQGSKTKQPKRPEEVLNSIRNAVASANTNDLKQAMNEYHKSSNHQMNEAKQALEGQIITSPSSRMEIESTLENLNDLESKLNSMASSSFMENPNSVRTQQSMSQNIDQLHKAHRQLQSAKNKAIISDLVVSCPALTDRKSPWRPYGAIHEHSSKGNKPALTSALHEFDSDASKLIELGSMAAESVQASGNPEMAKDILVLRDKLNDLKPGVGAAAAVVCVNPEDPISKDHFNKVAGMWEEGVKDLQLSLVDQEGAFKLHELVAGTRGAYNQLSENLGKAMEAKDNAEAQHQMADLVGASEAFLQLAKKELEYISTSSQPEDQIYRTSLEARIKEVEKVLPKFSAGAKGVLETLAGKLGAEELEGVYGHVKDLAHKFVNLGDLIRAHKGVVGPSGGALDEKEYGSGGSVDVEKAVASMAESIAAPADGSGAPVSTNAPELEVHGISVQVLEHALADVVLVEEEPPVLLPEAEAKANPIQVRKKKKKNRDSVSTFVETVLYLWNLLIYSFFLFSTFKAAAQELKVEASHWTSQGNPIIEAAQDISDVLAQLSHFHNLLKRDPTPESKKSFIKSAQDICSQSQKLLSYASPLSERCLDKRLKGQLKGSLDRVTTLGQQLKILAAVKTSAPMDTDRDQQLIACAQNLMVGVKNCLKESEAASLRVPGPPAGGGSAAVTVRFRRNVYRRQRK
jgi:hypothetical protein